MKADYRQTVVGLALRRSLGAFLPMVNHGAALVISVRRAGLAAALEGGRWRGKFIVLGPPPAGPARVGLRAAPGLPDLAGMDEAPSAAGDRPYGESRALLVYGDHPLLAGLAPRRRPFLRYDYAEEWNNLGFGRIRADASPWGVRGGLVPDEARELAGLYIRDGEKDVYAGAYLTLLDTPEATVLWCARPAGPVDSPEWSVVERFLSDWRTGELPGRPALRQTPEGCRCLATLRLDADEAIAPARDLFSWYAGQRLPFSLAVKTSLPLGPLERALIKDILAAGGSLLSHSHTHPLNWGAGYAEARREAEASRDILTALDPAWPRLAVSPFHRNPPYALRALRRAGYRGFVGGLTGGGEPEYILGRAGLVPFAGGRLIGFSQQSMLHGDSYRRQGGSVAVHIRAFEAQYASNGLFGYLDHPFSERYQYDWADEKQRLAAHEKLVAALRSRPGVWFWSQGRCFDFLEALSAVRLSMDRRGRPRASGWPAALPWRPVYRYQGEERAAG